MRRQALWIFWTFALVLARAGAADAPRDVLPLQTELKTSGPRVSIRLPLGARYRPGAAVPVEVRVNNPGAAFSAEVFFVEGDGDEGVRSGIFDALTFAPQTTRVFTLPVRLPPVTPQVTLHIRARDASGGIGPQLFRASLAKTLKPLPPESRVVLYCAAVGAPGWMSDTVRISGADLPAEAWMYESVDLVVLGDGALRDATPAAKAALKQWLAGGGRLFVASNEALAPAVAAELLPFAADEQGQIGSDRAWWEKRAGLTAKDVLSESNNRPVYVALRLGFGRIICLFPGTSNDDARRFGAQIANHSLLERPRMLLPDARVQPDRYNAFVFGGVDGARRGTAGLWAILGGVALCAGLLLGRASRSVWMALGWPLAIAALLGVMLAQWFPPRDVAQARVTFARHAPDGTASMTQEWTLIESFHQPVVLTLRAPAGGTVMTLHSDSDEPKMALYDVLSDSDELVLRDALVSPQMPLLAECSRAKTSLPHATETISLHSSEPLGWIRVCPPESWTVLGRTLVPKHLVWASGGNLKLLSTKDGNKWDVKRFDGWPALLRETEPHLSESTAKARAAALIWASREALRGEEAVISWQEETAAARGAEELLEIEGRRIETTGRFRIDLVRVKEHEEEKKKQ